MSRKNFNAGRESMPADLPKILTERPVKRGNTFGVARLIMTEELAGIEAAIIDFPDLKKRSKPGVLHVSPLNRHSKLTNGQLANGRGKEGIKDVLSDLTELDQESASSEVNVPVLGFRFRPEYAGSSRNLLRLVVGDVESKVYRSGFQLLGELAILSNLAGVEDPLVELMEDRARQQRVPYFTINLGTFKGSLDLAATSNEVVKSEFLPENIGLSGLRPI
jgi:hypothetical protein